MTTFKRLFVAGLLSLSLAACVSISAVPAGDVQIKSDYTVTTTRMWSDISALYPMRNKKVRVLTIDGPWLNQLFLTEGLTPGESLMRSAVKERPAPAYRAGMSATERMEFVADSISAQDYRRVETARPRPAKFAGSDAIRFDLTAQTPSGLDMQGTALMAEVDGRLLLILYFAPAEHYFGASLAEVERIMGSARR